MPPVDLTNFTDEQKKLFNRANALGSGVATIDSSSLAPVPSPIQIPDLQQQDPRELQADTQSSLDLVNRSIESLTQQRPAAEANQSLLIQDILGTLQQSQGRDAAQLAAEQEAGIPEQTRQLQELSGRLQALQAESLAIPLQIQEEFAGRGVTTAGIRPIQTGSLRQNAIQSLTLGAQAQALQGNIALARQQVSRAVDLQFKPIEDRLQFLTTTYELNKDLLERVDKRRSERLEIALNERSRLLQTQKAEREGIQNIMIQAAEFGANQNILDKISSAGSIEDAVRIAGANLRDPTAIQALKNAQLDAKLRQIQINREQAELDLFRKYGGLSPEEWTKQQKEENDGTDQSVITEINNNLTQVDAILNSPGLQAVVGPTPFARSAQRQGESFLGLGQIVPSITGIFTPGKFAAEIGGSADDTVALTEQLISQQFLDKLISSKGQGATFGQLSDREGAALRAAATAIGQAAIRDKKDKVIGYDMSESEFKKQMGVIRERINFAKQKWVSDAVTDEEEAALDEFFNTEDFNALDYYGI